MGMWIDPELDEALTTAGLVAFGEVEDADPRGGRIRLVRVLAGDATAGSVVTVERAREVGRGHEGATLPRATFLFVVGGDAGRYQAFTDSYWAFPISDGDRVHMPIRDPFTRAYILHDDLADLVSLVRDRSPARAAQRDGYLHRQVQRLQATPVQATRPIEVNEQIVALESLALLAQRGGTQVRVVIPFLGSPHYQIRWSAVRALGSAGGPDALAALVGLLATEDVPPVQAALAEGIFALVALAGDAALRPVIVQALPRMFATSELYARNIMSPIANRWPSPRDTLAAVVMKLDGQPGDLAALRGQASAYLASLGNERQ